MNEERRQPTLAEVLRARMILLGLIGGTVSAASPYIEKAITGAGKTPGAGEVIGRGALGVGAGALAGLILGGLENYNRTNMAMLTGDYSKVALPPEVVERLRRIEESRD